MNVKSPYILKKLFPGLIWEIVTPKKEVFLTFDDGPHPEVTPWILKCLDDYDAKATFFCVGENVCKYPDIYNTIINKGHMVGNHSYNHLSGWKTTNYEYFENIEKAGELIESRLFRPPYGRITPSQIKILKHDFRIIMWSILTYDYDVMVSKEQCLKNSIKSTKSGSIVVFHDSAKSYKNLYYTLPLFLEHFTKLGFRFNPMQY